MVLGALPHVAEHGVEDLEDRLVRQQRLLALLDQPDGLARPLFEKIGVVAANLQSQLEAAIAKRAQAHGMTAQTNPAAELLAILRQAERRWQN